MASLFKPSVNQYATYLARLERHILECKTLDEYKKYAKSIDHAQKVAMKYGRPYSSLRIAFGDSILKKLSQLKVTE